MINQKLDVYLLANETEAYHDGTTKYDKRLFIDNLGILLSQTRANIQRCEYVPEREIVKVVYRNGYEKEININMDSYLAIIKDVVRNLED